MTASDYALYKDRLRAVRRKLNLRQVDVAYAIGASSRKGVCRKESVQQMGEIATSGKAKDPTTKKDQLKQFIREMDEKYGTRVDTIDLSPTPVAPRKPERTVKGWTVYRHFKGGLYRVMEVAEHTETGEKFVIYRALYGAGKVYARPVDMFLSHVDRKKYPNATQEYRFEEAEP